MLILFDKTNGKRITDFGKNHEFPQGVPYEPQDNEVIYRIHDDDQWIAQYLAGDIANVTATIVNGEVTAINIPVFVPPEPPGPQPPTEVEVLQKETTSLRYSDDLISSDLTNLIEMLIEKGVI